MTPMKIDYSKSKIILSSAFEKKCFIPGTVEYAQLQAVRNDYPDFTLVTRQFKTNTKQEHFKGLTYDFMRKHISSHEKDAKSVLDELEEMIGISKAHSLGKRYPTIKAWFLKRYPEVAKHGMTEEQLAKFEAAQKSAEPQADTSEFPESNAA